MLKISFILILIIDFFVTVYTQIQIGYFSFKESMERFFGIKFFSYNKIEIDAILYTIWLLLLIILIPYIIYLLGLIFKKRLNKTFYIIGIIIGVMPIINFLFFIVI